ncbi:MAG: hypothetical protein WD768_02095 [Phycisphaeraceae bacterium]
MVDPIKNQALRSVSEVASQKLDKVALNPQPLPPKVAHGYADGAVVAASADKVSLNPQPLPPKENPTVEFDAIAQTSLASAAALRSDISIKKLPQIGSIVGDILEKVALNPQPLPPRVIGNIVADVLSRIGIIIVSGQPEEDEMHPPAPRAGNIVDQRVQQAGIIIVSGQPEEEEMHPPAPRRGGQAFPPMHLEQVILEAIRQAATKPR